jgi:hypothetical protein
MSPLRRRSHSGPYSGLALASRLSDTHPGRSHVHAEPPTSRLIHHALLALSPASRAIYLSDHVPADLPGMPRASSTRRSHSRSSTDTGPLPTPSPVHHWACTMPRTVSALRTSVPLGSLRHSGSSSASACPPIQPAPPGRCSDDPVKWSFSSFPALHVLPGLLRPAHCLPMPRLRRIWLPMTIGDSLVVPERTPVLPSDLGPWPPPDSSSS